MKVLSSMVKTDLNSSSSILALSAGPEKSFPCRPSVENCFLYSLNCAIFSGSLLALAFLYIRCFFLDFLLSSLVDHAWCWHFDDIFKGMLVWIVFSMHDFTASRFSSTVFRWSSSRKVFPKSDTSCFILCQRACENTWIFLGTFLVYAGMTSLSAMMAPSWPDTPSTVVMCLTKAGLFVMKRSSMFPSLVVSICSCDRLLSCRMPMNFSLACFRLALLFTDSSSQSMSLKLKSPPSMMVFDGAFLVIFLRFLSDVSSSSICLAASPLGER